MDFLAKIKNIVRKVLVTGPADNSTQFPVQQMAYKGKTVNVETIYPYGFYANCASTISGAIMFSVDGSENNRVAIPYTPQRPIDLEQDEISVYHPKTQTYVKFRNNANLEIDTDVDGTGGDLIINSDDIDVTAVDISENARNISAVVSENMTASVTGDIITSCENHEMNATDVVIEASSDINAIAANVYVSDDATVRGNLTVDGVTSLNGGPAIARVGDSVQVVITSGSSAGTWTGTITSGGVNTSA